MAEVYRRIGGKPFQEWLAHYRPVQVELFARTRDMASEAAIILAAHRDSGDSFIEIEHGIIDYHIILNDTRGQKAAMSIEYGRSPNESGVGGMEGLRVLHRATGLGGE